MMIELSSKDWVRSIPSLIDLSFSMLTPYPVDLKIPKTSPPVSTNLEYSRQFITGACFSLKTFPPVESTSFSRMLTVSSRQFLLMIVFRYTGTLWSPFGECLIGILGSWFYWRFGQRSFRATIASNWLGLLNLSIVLLMRHGNTLTWLEILRNLFIIIGNIALHHLLKLYWKLEMIQMSPIMDLFPTLLVFRLLRESFMLKIKKKLRMWLSEELLKALGWDLSDSSIKT